MGHLHIAWVWQLDSVDAERAEISILPKGGSKTIRRQKNRFWNPSTPIPVNNIQSKMWFTVAPQRISRFENEVYTLPHQSQRLRFLYSLVWHFPQSLKSIVDQEMQKEIESRSITMTKIMFWPSRSRTVTDKINGFLSSKSTTFSFFPLFGILVIHLSSVNAKHDGIKAIFFAVTMLKASGDRYHTQFSFGAATNCSMIGWYFLWHSVNHVVSTLMKAREYLTVSFYLVNTHA